MITGLTLFAPDTIPGPLHAYVMSTPASDPDASSPMLGTLQVNSCADAIAANGAFSEMTSTVVVLVQPLSRSTTVKVYVPRAFTSVVAADGVVPAGFPEALVQE